MPDTNKRQRFTIDDAEKLYSKYLDNLIPEVEMLEHINEHQRILYLPAPSSPTPTFNFTSVPIREFESYTPTD